MANSSSREQVATLVERAQYPTYRSSGVAWLGDIPAHWQVRRLKYVADINPEALGDDTDPDREILYVDIGSVDSNGQFVEGELLTFADAPSRARRLVREGDTILSTVRTYLRAIAHVRKPDPRLVVSTGFAVIRPKSSLVPSYAGFVLRAPFFVERVVANSTGVSFPAISERELATFEIPVPPVDEQRSIADFLERETVRIDALIAKKERLISLLKAGRTSQIKAAFAKGLDRDVPPREPVTDDSGQRWPKMAIKRLAKLEAGQGITSESIRPVGEFPVYGGNGIRGFTDTYTHDGTYPLIGRQGALCGAVHLVSGKFWASEHAIVASVRDGVDPQWLAGLLESMSLNDYSQSAAQPGLSIETIETLHTSVPPIAEQQRIVTIVAHHRLRVASLIRAVRDAIERLNELRGSITSAGVTGTIDLRTRDND